MDLKDAQWQGDWQADGNTGKPHFRHRGHEFPSLSHQHPAPWRKARSQVRRARQRCRAHKGTAKQQAEEGLGRRQAERQKPHWGQPEPQAAVSSSAREGSARAPQRLGARRLCNARVNAQRAAGTAMTCHQDTA